MLVLAVSAAIIGFLHSLSPGHWLPLLLVVKSRKWNWKQATLGAFIASLGHVLVSCALGLMAGWLGHQFLSHELEDQLMKYSGIFLVIFGLIYALGSYFTHIRCVGHEHHGPDVNQKALKAPFLFLFSLGLVPCFAVLPVILTSINYGMVGVILTCVLFSIGVFAAFFCGGVLVSKKIFNLDHPLFEHYGDVLTGLFVMATGTLFIFMHP